MKSRIRKNFSLGAKEYDSLAELQERSARELLKRLKLLKEIYPLLDVGSGTGKNLPLRAVSVDIAFKMAKRCKERGKPSVCGDCEELPFKEGSFKTVFSNFSLQWTDLKKSFNEIYRVLKPNGFFVCALPTKGSLETFFRCIRESGSSLKTFNFPSEKEVINHLKGAGFELVEFQRYLLEKEYKSPKEAVRAVNKIGARNPYGRLKKSEVLKFIELFKENPKVEYKVLAFTARRP